VIIFLKPRKRLFRCKKFDIFVIYDIVYLSDVAPKKLYKEELMRAEFWIEVYWGVILTLLVLFLVGIIWYAHRMDYVSQTRSQAAYLTELSEYKGWEKIPGQDSDAIKKLIDITMTLAVESQNPEMSLLGKLTFSKDKGEDNFGDANIVQLILDYPGAVNLALKGKESPAQELQEKWYKTRHIGFYPFGMTLMLIFLVGMFITIIVASEFCFKKYSFLERNRDNLAKKYNQNVEMIDYLLRQIGIYPR